MCFTRNGKSVILAAAVFLSALLIVANPPAVRHEEAIRAEFAALHPLFEPLGFSISAMYLPSYRSLGVASFTTHNSEVTSFGMLGQVWVFPRGFTSPAEPKPHTLVVSPDEASFYE